MAQLNIDCIYNKQEIKGWIKIGNEEELKYSLVKDSLAEKDSSNNLEPEWFCGTSGSNDNDEDGP